MTTIQNSVDSEKTNDTRFGKQNNRQQAGKMHTYLTPSLKTIDKQQKKASDAFFLVG